MSLRTRARIGLAKSPAFAMYASMRGSFFGMTQDETSRGLRKAFLPRGNFFANNLWSLDKNGRGRNSSADVECHHAPGKLLVRGTRVAVVPPEVFVPPTFAGDSRQNFTHAFQNYVRDTRIGANAS